MHLKNGSKHEVEGFSNNKNEEQGVLDNLVVAGVFLLVLLVAWRQLSSF